jgi:hypothetical protein
MLLQINGKESNEMAEEINRDPFFVAIALLDCSLLPLSLSPNLQDHPGSTRAIAGGHPPHHWNHPPIRAG